MKDAKFERHGKVIIDLSVPAGDPARARDFKSINKAKQESAKIQMREDGALGRGSLRVA